MSYCYLCQKPFPHERALFQHQQDSPKHQWQCDDCDIDFSSWDGLKQHYQQSPNHHYCKECDRQFVSDDSRRQHMDAKHWYCGIHNKLFKSEDGLDQHYTMSKDHHYCLECEEDFDDDDDLWDHFQGEHDACSLCRLHFDSKRELQEHDSEEHYYCIECDRFFQNESNLRHHINSKLHQSSNVRCPGRGCNKAFVSPSALTLHFESGTCRSGMTREQLNRLVVKADKNNYITNTARLLGGPPGEYHAPATVNMLATVLSWNGSAYECFLCNATFNDLQKLNQHLQSPRHDEKIYKCPKPDCRIEFVTLSGLCQHVEGGSCGVRMFKQVQNAMESLTRGFNSIKI